MTYVFKIVDSPVGPLKLVASYNGLAAILWENDDPNRVPLGTLIEDPDNPILRTAAKQLAEYFAGKRKAFDVPLDFKGTPFEESVWTELRTIPFGKTRSYADIARALGRPSAVREVEAAGARNPIAIMTPCHRAIGEGGSVAGFAGGPETGKRLLGLERSGASGQIGRDNFMSKSSSNN